MSRSFSKPIGAEAGLRDDVVGELEPEQIGDERVVAVGDIGEWTAMDKRRLPLERLDEARLQRLPEQGGHRACGAELLGCYRVTVDGGCDRDLAEPVAQVGEVARDRHDRHHLGRGGDVEAGPGSRPTSAATSTIGRSAPPAERAPDYDVQAESPRAKAAPPRPVGHRGRHRTPIRGKPRLALSERPDVGNAAGSDRAS